MKELILFDNNLTGEVNDMYYQLRVFLVRMSYVLSVLYTPVPLVFFSVEKYVVKTLSENPQGRGWASDRS